MRIAAGFAIVAFTAVGCGTAPPPAEPGKAPTIAGFVANPPAIEAGQAATLTWDVSGADSIDIQPGARTAGTSLQVTPAATTTYTLTASNAAGSATATATVTVTAGIRPAWRSERRTIASGGAARLFLLARPDPMPARPLPLVFSLHWDGGDGAAMRAALPLEAQAAAGAVFVYPDAPGGTFEYWTSDGRAREAQFVKDVIASLSAELGIDTSRVFMAGMSGGATMANALGCRLGPGILRGLGIHSGTLYPVDDDFTYTNPGGVSCALPATLFVWGTADDSADTSYANGQAVRDNYLATQQCAATSTPWSVDPCQTYDSCSRAVAWCPIDGLGHAIWPGAAAALWRFFDSLAGGGANGACSPASKLDLWSRGLLHGANVFMGRNPGGASNGFGDGDFSQSDFDDLRAAGANYVHISHAGLFSETPPYQLDTAARDSLDAALGMAARAHLYAAVAFRSGPGRNEAAITNRGGNVLESIWTDQDAQDAWVQMIRYAADRYNDNPSLVGIDPMVEPNDYARRGYLSPEDFYAAYGGTLEDFNLLAAKVTTAIRAVDALTPILLEGEGFGGVRYLPYLAVTGDARTVYTVHDYTPFEYTNETEAGATYPGMYDVNGDGNPVLVDRAFLAQWVGAVKSYGSSHHVPVAFTEFGAHRTQPNAAGYLQDRVDLQAPIGSWAVWTWQPAGFADPFSMHEASASLDVLKSAWQGSCAAP
jgi:polyhydroxybutyrate depolymerase